MIYKQNVAEAANFVAQFIIHVSSELSRWIVIAARYGRVAAGP